jgi:tight adherence protein B
MVGVVVALLVGWSVYAVSASPVLAVTFAILAAYLPREVVASRAARQAQRRRQDWPDVVDNIASAVRAGLALPEAVAQVCVRGPAALRPAFAEFAADYRLTGRFGDGLDLLKARLADPVADRLVESLRLARDVGGSDLGRLLRTLSAFLRDESRIRAELEARQSWSVNAARLAVLAPWLVLAMLATRAESLQAYNTPAGATVLGIGLAVTAVAYRVMLRIGRLPAEERVLR